MDKNEDYGPGERGADKQADKEAEIDAWMDAKAAMPAQSAVMVAATAEKDKADREFSEAFNKDDAKAVEPKAADPVPKKAEEPMSFKAAFASARADGKKVFEWKGTQYSTKLLDKPKATEAAKPVAEKAGSATVAEPPSKPQYQSAVMRQAEMERKYAAQGTGMYGSKKATPSTSPSIPSAMAGKASVSEAVPRNAFMGKTKS